MVRAQKETIVRTRAAVAWEANKPLDVTEVIIAPPQKGEVRIKVRTTRLFWVLVFFLFIPRRQTRCC